MSPSLPNNYRHHGLVCHVKLDRKSLDVLRCKCSSLANGYHVLAAQFGFMIGIPSASMVVSVFVRQHGVIFSNTRPGFPIEKITNSRPRDMIVLSNQSHCFTTPIPLVNGVCLLLCQLCASIGLFCWGMSTSLCNRIIDIFTMCPFPEMMVIATWRIVATMTDIKVWIDISIEQFKCPPMRERPIVCSATASIAVLVARACPWPTTLHAIFPMTTAVNYVPKT
jgi:hypothetical protein